MEDESGFWVNGEGNETEIGCDSLRANALTT
jgi:hypothetical protein